jgi:hypothetical protein
MKGAMFLAATTLHTTPVNEGRRDGPTRSAVGSWRSVPQSSTGYLVARAAQDMLEFEKTAYLQRYGERRLIIRSALTQ